MNFQSEYRIRSDKAHSRPVYVTSKCYNMNSLKTRYHFMRDQQEQDVIGNVINECDLFSTIPRVKNKVGIPPYVQNEPWRTLSRASSDDISSHLLHTENKYPPKVPSFSKIETKVNEKKYDVKKKCDIRDKVSFVPGLVKIEEKSHTNNEKPCSDKATYCRPVLKITNTEFLYKTMQKNLKLESLVKELIIARQKEKEIENWNNYINELRKKHGKDRFSNTRSAPSLQFISEQLGTSDTFNDYNNHTATFIPKQCYSYQNSPQDFYNIQDISSQHNNYYKSFDEYTQTPNTCSTFGTNPLCYPTSSQRRHILLERERLKRLGNGYKASCKSITEENIIERNLRQNVTEVVGPDKKYIFCNSRGTNTSMEMLHTECTQTEFQVPSSKNTDVQTNKQLHTKYILDFEKPCKEEVCIKNIAQDNLQSTNNNLKQNSLGCIEEKLDNLIRSINNFLIQIKTKSPQEKYIEQRNIKTKKNLSYTRSDNCYTARRDKNLYSVIDNNSSRTTSNYLPDNFSKIHSKNYSTKSYVLVNGISKDKLITVKGSSETTTYRPCSVQISVTIPTKETATEVTRSLYNAGSLGDRNTGIEEIPRKEERRIAIAVNTDPLSLLTLLKVSTEETFRRLLSYVPSIDYYYYLPKIQSPTTSVESQFVCNICGAAFVKPSALTDHIRNHDLGNTRDCCVCRHVVDKPRRRQCLFKCQYCGQRFARAYCCELHQEACARRLGQLHDVKSSLVLLR